MNFMNEKRVMLNYNSILIATMFLLVSAYSYSQEKVDIIGAWKNNTYQVSYVFQKDGSVLFTQGSSTVFIPSYTLDLEKEPVWIDFKMSNLTIPGLIEIVDENTIIIEQFPPFSKHPEAFSEDRDDGIVTKHTLTKVE